MRNTVDSNLFATNHTVPKLETGTIPAVSVIMPFFNSAAYVGEAIKSILAQTHQDFELVVINDASSDDSDGIVRQFLGDGRIKYVKNGIRKGKAANLNMGISMARAELIACMDGDDVSHPERLSKELDFMHKNPEVQLVGTFVQVVDEGGVVVGHISKPTSSEDIRRVCFYYGPHVQATTMYRKSAVLAAGMYREKYEYTEDTDLFLRMIFGGDITANIPEYLYEYRQHSNSTAQRGKEIGRKSLQLKKELIKKYKLKIGFTNYLSMYVHFFLDMTLTGQQKRNIQLQIKKLIRT